MPTYLFRFGYETPIQQRNNQLHGWDDEDSHAILIKADDEEAALFWGEQIAERFVSLLFCDSGVSSKQGRFASWLDKTPTEFDYPSVKYEEYPDFEPWLKGDK